MTRRAALLIAIWLVFLARGSFYAAFLPLWEGFDEYAHFSFLQYVGVSTRLPATSEPVSAEVEESLRLVPLPWELRGAAPPALTHDAYWRLPEAERASRESAFANSHRAGGYTPGSGNLLLHEAQQPPLYYWLFAPLLKLAAGLSLPARVLILRLAAILLASLVVPFGFLLCREVLRDDARAFCVVAATVLMPELMFDIARVGNDCLALPLFTLLVFLSLRFLSKPESRRTALLLGLVCGAGLLTKAYFLTALPVLLLFFACTLFRARTRRMLVFTNIALALGVAGTISAWWYWRNYQETGSWAGETNTIAAAKLPLTALLAAAARVDWRNALDSTLTSYIWCGGWSFLGVRSWIYHFFESVALAIAAGLLLALVRYARHREAPGMARLGHFLTLVAFCGFFCLGLAYHVTGTLVNYKQSASAGWYLCCLAVVEVLLIYLGLSSFAARRLRNLGRWVLPALACSFALLELYAIHFIALPYYAGLIGHRANGMLEAFHPAALRAPGFSEFLRRLAVNKAPILTGGVIGVLWVAFVAATVITVILTFRFSAEGGVESAAQGQFGVTAGKS